jgi:hypothetical protein
MPGVEAEAGMTLSVRSFGFDVPSGAAPLQAYRGSPVPGLHLGLAAYPLALAGSSGTLAGFGLYFAFDRAFSITSRLEGQAGASFGTRQSSLSLGAAWRHRLGGSASSPSLGARFGYGSLSFSIDDPMALVQLPDVAYSYLELGLAGRVPLTRAFALVASLAYLPVLDAGEIADPARNTSNANGRGSAWGLDLRAGIDVRPFARVALGLEFRLTRFAHSFESVGGAPLGATSASDTYTGGLLTGAFLY